MNPQIPGIQRQFASVPTSDTERQALYTSGGKWSPTEILIFDHRINIDIPTGNLIVFNRDVGHQYYNFILGINRKYDIQEQHMQQTYYKNYPNVNPKPHWFGNWQFAYEADVDEVWQKSYPELHITSSIGANGLFETKLPDFMINIKDESLTQRLLVTYGIPKRTLEELDWNFSKNDFLLRTIRGPFMLLTGHFNQETLVDDIDADMWLFNPMSGSGFHVSSENFYNVTTTDNNYRDVGYPLTVTKLVDALGHKIELKPATTIANPPFYQYVLSDGSGRNFQIHLDKELTFLDGLNPGRKVRKLLVTKVVDWTKTNHNEFRYQYNSEYLLEQVTYPSSTGKNRFIKYLYENPNYSGILTGIENSQGHKIKFEYYEDTTDNDERLNPRLKIKKIIDPEGIEFEYEYDHLNSEVIVTISQNRNIDRKIKYQYIRDLHNTKQRYITVTETEVTRGYLRDFNNRIIPRNDTNTQIIRNTTNYTTDGRFNIEKQIDPLGRVIRHQYNEFNQVEKTWDFDNHRTKYVYDIPSNPSSSNPIRYDLVSVTKRNILRTINESSSRRPIIETEDDVIKEYKYDRYDTDNSISYLDHGTQSTHRVSEEIDERRSTSLKVWTYTYDDHANHNPLSPTLIESPLGETTQKTYDKLGHMKTYTDAENNVHGLKYNDQGNIIEYVEPNGASNKLTYYSESNWIHTFEDEFSKIIELIRDVEGKITKIIDPEQDMVEYEYSKNGRLHKTINHRPVVHKIPNVSTSHSMIIPYPNLETEFQFSPLGALQRLKNPNGLVISYDYDENGRMYQIYQMYNNIPNSKKIFFVYDEGGQILQSVDRKGKSTIYTYYNSGNTKTIQYPDWNDDGINSIRGKLVEFKKYDHDNRILSIKDSEIRGTKEFIYDEAGNLVTRRDPDGFELKFSYDDNNRMQKVKGLSGNFELSLTLDNLGRTKHLSDSASLDGSLSWEYKYEKQVGTVTKRLNLFEQNIPSIGLSSEYDYDKKDRLTTLNNLWQDSTPISIYKQNMHYRNDDLIDKITDYDSDSFRYDGIKQLIYEKKGNLSVDYDQAGNRLYQDDKTATPNPTRNVYNIKNQLRKDSKIPASFTYDDNGNTRTSTYPVNPTEFYFDGINQLRLIKSNQNKISYLYDSEGRLVKRIVKDTNTGTEEKTTFHYLATKPILIERNNRPLMLLTWDTNGKLLRIRRHQSISTGNYSNSLFPLYDGLDNIIMLVDDAKNTPVKITYDAWGNIKNLQDPGNLFEFWGYKGGIFDKLTDNLLFGARWYSPKLGRWLSEDPLLYDLSSDGTSNIFENYKDLGNLYQYSVNDPVNMSDLSGLGAKGKIVIRVIRFIAGGSGRARLLRKGGAVGKKQATNIVRNEGHVIVEGGTRKGREKIAREIARGASPTGRSTRHLPHGPGQHEHFHPLDVVGNHGHVLFNATAFFTATYWLGDNFLGNLVDFFNPLGLPNDVVLVVQELTALASELEETTSSPSTEIQNQ